MAAASGAAPRSARFTRRGCASEHPPRWHPVRTEAHEAALLLAEREVARARRPLVRGGDGVGVPPLVADRRIPVMPLPSVGRGSEPFLDARLGMADELA